MTATKNSTGAGKLRLGRPSEQVETGNRTNPDGLEVTVDKVVAAFTRIDDSDSGEPVYGVPRSYIVDQTRVADELRRRTRDLGERVKELDCLYRISRLKDRDGQTMAEFLQAVVEVIPPAWSNSEITCARITYEDREFCSRGFRKTGWSQSAKVIHKGRVVGHVEVCHLKETMIMDEGPFLREERDLIEAVARDVSEYIERKLAGEELLSISNKLRRQQAAYQQKNAALREVLSEIENDRKQTALQIQANVDRLVGPILRKVEEKISPSEKGYVSMLRNCLSGIASPFVSKLSARYARLSPREVEVCNLIRHGLTSKEISTNLNISEETVRNQRKSIRRKLGITSHKTNLNTFLQTI